MLHSNTRSRYSIIDGVEQTPEIVAQNYVSDVMKKVTEEMDAEDAIPTKLDTERSRFSSKSKDPSMLSASNPFEARESKGSQGSAKYQSLYDARGSNELLKNKKSKLSMDSYHSAKSIGKTEAGSPNINTITPLKDKDTDSDDLNKSKPRQSIGYTSIFNDAKKTPPVKSQVSYMDSKMTGSLADSPTRQKRSKKVKKAYGAPSFMYRSPNTRIKDRNAEATPSPTRMSRSLSSDKFIKKYLSPSHQEKPEWQTYGESPKLRSTPLESPNNKFGRYMEGFKRAHKSPYNKRTLMKEMPPGAVDLFTRHRSPSRNGDGKLLDKSISPSGKTGRSHLNTSGGGKKRPKYSFMQLTQSRINKIQDPKFVGETASLKPSFKKIRRNRSINRSRQGRQSPEREISAVSNTTPINIQTKQDDDDHKRSKSAINSRSDNMKSNNNKSASSSIIETLHRVKQVGTSSLESFLNPSGVDDTSPKQQAKKKTKKAKKENFDDLLGKYDFLDD